MDNKKTLFNFCHGWMLDKSYSEVTCKQRSHCAFYDEEFYRHYGDRLDEFEEMFPFDPCPYFLEKTGGKPEEKTNDELFAAFVKGR